jgi:phosphohistidine phosphatase
MELVLIRHGEAEERIPAFADANRALTTRGARKLKKAMKVLPVLLKNPDEVLVWSSPMLRAAQSARIVADRCDVAEPAVRDFLGNGDFSEFTKALLEVRSTSTLILVGHEPFLGDWCRRIAGCSFDIGKGDAFAIVLDRLDPPSGSLRWKIDRQTLARLGK